MRIGLREANQHFSRTIRKVRAGRTVVLTDHGRPVAVIKPVDDSTDVEERFQRLVDLGLIRPARKKGPLPPVDPIKLRGKPMSATISEGRDEE